MDDYPSSFRGTWNAGGSAVVPDFAGRLATVFRDRGSSQFDAPSEPLIIAPQVPVTTDGKLQALRNVLDTHSIDQLLAKVNAH